MKRHAYRFIAAATLVVGTLLFAAPAFAGEGDDYIAALPQARINLIEQNVVLALTSNIPGMQADAAQLVRDLRTIRPEQSFSATVIPLMAIVKDEQADPGARVLAAFALDRLESSMGHYAITRTALFTDNPKVKHVCTWLAYERRTGRSSENKGMAIIEPLEEFEY
ncbi:MAG: hypothetical protein AB1428_13800 [Bacteroidota bacterium]